MGAHMFFLSVSGVTRAFSSSCQFVTNRMTTREAAEGALGSAITKNLDPSSETS